MPSILVLEQDPRSLERIHDTLGAAGWRVRIVQEPEQAFQAARSERPDLVIVGAAVTGAETVTGSFSRRTGGPGVLGLLPPGTSPADFGGLAADELLRQPFSDQELVAAVQRAGTAPRAAAPAPSRPRGDSKLTSQDIFGDVLAEVEMAGAEPAEPASPAAAAPVPAALRPAPPRPPVDDDINRKLEQTLSGVFGSDLGRPRPAAAVAPAPPRPAPSPAPARPAAPPPRRPELPGDDDIDAILSRTLGNMGPRPRPAAPPAPPAPSAPPPRPAEGPAARKSAKLDGGLAELEELTRTFRAPAAPPAPAPPPRAVAPEPPRPAMPPAPAPPVAAPPAPAAPAPLPEAPAPPPVAPPFSATTAATPLFDLEPPALSDLPDLPAFPDLAVPAPRAPAPAPLDPVSGSLFGNDPFDLTALELPPPEEPEPVRPPEPAFAPEPEAPFELVDLELEPEIEIEPEPVPVEPEPPPLAAVPPEPAPAGASVLGGPAPDVAATQRIQIPVLDDSTLNVPGAERFGQYTLLEKIAAGGMAEVWKARMRGVEGFQKTVAIKKILPHMTDNSEFIGMFIDEAKLAAQLSHPNIVHIYDLGKIGRDYYIAMEYVEGKDLRSLLNAARRKGTPLSLGLALYVAARVASALDYAHRKRDFEGKELGLVHRDVSPQNVLLAREGDVKLCDFGIAKAVSKAGQTQMGSLKGKLQYMSPEQAWGRPVDARSDIFSLGAVLFEMLTGDRLFSGDSEMSILEAVRHGRIRTPRDVDPSIPAEVDEIVTRALAYDVRDRFQSAGEMMQRIESVLHTLVPSPGPSELAAYLERATAPEPSSSDLLFIPPPPAPTSPVRLPAPEVPPSLFSSPAGAEPPVPMAIQEAAPVEAVAPVGEVHVEEAGGRRSRLFLFIAIAVLLIAAVVFFVWRGRRGGEPAPPAARPPATQPAPAVQPSTPAAAPPAATQAPPAAEPIDVNAILKEELAKRDKELRRKYEAQAQQLERELAKAQKDAEKKAASGGQKPPAEQPPP